jgi:hypothetical protein
VAQNFVPGTALIRTETLRLRSELLRLSLVKTSCTRRISPFAAASNWDVPIRFLAMIVSLRHLLGWIFTAFSSREDLILENLALRQQLLALHAKRPRRRLSILQKVFWVVLKSLWLGWRKPLVLVTPRTVVGWHRAGFRLYWTWVSRARRVGGRRRVS